MIKRIAGFALMLISTCAFSQSNAERYAALITEEQLKTQLTIIAGPQMEGRETATEGQRRAAAYIADQFKQAGVVSAAGTKDYQQDYPLFSDTVSKAAFKIRGRLLEWGKDFLMPVQYNGDNFIKANKLEFAGYGISDSTYDDYIGKNVNGKVVIIFSGEPKKDSIYLVTGKTRQSKWSGNNAKLLLARQKGAVGVILINPLKTSFKHDDIAGASQSDIYYPGKRNAGNDKTNMIYLSHAAAGDLIGTERFNRLLAKAKASETLADNVFVIKNKLQFDYKENKTPRSSTNVIGGIEGTDKKDEYVIITGHYDHLGKKGDIVFNGADDDGSGTVSVVEIAKAFAVAKAEGNGPRRSIIFMTVSGEEKGLWGSQYYSENPLFPLDKTSVNLNIDMVGRIDPSRTYGDSMNYVYVIGEDRLSSDLFSITDSANKKSVQLELDRKFNANDPNRFYFRSDHYNFAKTGVPIIFYFNGTHADYHKASDTVDKINFDLMTKRVQLVFHTAWIVANRDAMLKRDIPLK